MEYKNNMFKLPVYIPNYNISNNQETEKKTDKKYKYTYVNIDSSYRQTEDVYEYYDPNDGNHYTKKFFVERQEDSLIYVDDIEETHEEFEIILNQCGEV